METVDPQTSRRPAAATGLRVGSGGLLLAAIAWFRLDGVTRGTLWAEDGAEFLVGALDGRWVFAPYQGYAHVVPRAVAQLVVWCVPAPQYAVAFTAAAVVISAAVGLLVFGLTAHLGLSPVARGVLASITVAAPALVTEVAGNLANLHWIFLWLAPWLFLARPTSTTRSALLGVVAFVAATTEIQVLVFAPLLLVASGDRRRRPLIAGALIGCSVQLGTFLTIGRDSPPGRPGLGTTIDGFVLQAAGGMWTSNVAPIARTVPDHGWAAVYLLLVPVAGALTAVFLVAPHLRVASAALAMGAAIVWAAGFQANYGAADQQMLVSSLRHAVVPSMFLLAVMVMAADCLLARRGTGAWLLRGVGATIAAAVVIAGVLSIDGRGDSLRRDGPAWRATLAHVQDVCDRRQRSTVDVVFAPGGPAWTVPVPCGRWVPAPR